MICWVKSLTTNLLVKILRKSGKVWFAFALSLSKLPPALYRRVKKHISDVLYEMGEQNDVEPGRCNVNDNIPQYGPRHYPSTFNSTLIIDPLVLVQPPAISITKPLMFPVETSK